ncbi:glycosyltransferase [Roseomonas populi]|uniref:Glycosyltransferase n=1 Tax=Roseomonas populi TaxID=3121582 RepID=A0ABT1X8Z7_9PROT|nr:glycosyltransferase [Roseomonas pecuniae]MCR0984241.1 glycosyltransferase [Roseomonas pecuniae]
MRDAHADLVEAGRGADLLLAGLSCTAAPMAAETLGIPWAPAVLQPIAFLSAQDPCLPPHLHSLAPLLPLGPLIGRPLRIGVRAGLRHLHAPINHLRAELGLRPFADPMLNGAAEPPLALALFSPRLAAAQPDWPAGARPTGAPIHDGTGLAPLAPDTRAWIEAGTPPVLATLGSSGTRGARGGTVLRALAGAASGLGRRTLVLSGSPAVAEDLGELPHTHIRPFVPVEEAMPLAGIVAHHGGAGSTAAGLRAGRPTLVLPITGDQFDHAARLARLGVALVLPAARATPDRVARALQRLAEVRRFALRAAVIGAEVRQEDGAGAAAALVTAFLRRAAPAPLPRKLALHA